MKAFFAGIGVLLLVCIIMFMASDDSTTGGPPKANSPSQSNSKPASNLNF